MTDYEVYQERKVEKGTIWLLFLLVGWSYGSMDMMGKQIFYYLTLGGFGFWSLYRLFTLNGAITKYNRKVALECGLGFDDLSRLGLT